MAHVSSHGTPDQRFALTTSWEQVAGVTTPELAATWCRLTITANGEDVTLLRSRDGSVGSGVYVSAYPLAEWFSENWWSLWGEQRAATYPVRDWSWRSAGAEPRRQRHNLCGAGGGMFWPDLALVPEGSLVRTVWWPRPASDGTRGGSFISGGEEWLSVDEVKEGAAAFVNRVVDRLDDHDLRDTPLQHSWRLVVGTRGEEAEFAEAAARLGEDPYSLHDDVAESLISLAETFNDGDLLGEFLDSVTIGQIDEAFNWLARVDRFVARHPKPEADESLLSRVIQGRPNDSRRTRQRPYEIGYEYARRAREATAIAPVQQIDMRPFVRVERFTDRSGGIDGYVPDTSRFILAIPDRIGAAGQKFRAAQALGLTMLSPGRRRFILDPSSTDLAQAARAFAAELLAPAEGIAEQLRVLVRADDDAFEAIGRRYGVSPTVIRHQHENQLAGTNW